MRWDDGEIEVVHTLSVDYNVAHPVTPPGEAEVEALAAAAKLAQAARNVEAAARSERTAHWIESIEDEARAFYEAMDVTYFPLCDVLGEGGDDREWKNAQAKTPEEWRKLAEKVEAAAGAFIAELPRVS